MSGLEIAGMIQTGLLWVAVILAGLNRVPGMVIRTKRKHAFFEDRHAQAFKRLKAENEGLQQKLVKLQNADYHQSQAIQRENLVLKNTLRQVSEEKTQIERHLQDVRARLKERKDIKMQKAKGKRQNGGTACGGTENGRHGTLNR